MNIQNIAINLTCQLRFQGIHPTGFLTEVNPVIFHLYDFRQEWVEFMFARLSRKRDYYIHNSDPDFQAYGKDLVIYAPIFLLFKQVADYLNHTFVSDNCAKQLNLTLNLYPQAFFAVNEFDGATYKLNSLWKTFMRNVNISDIGLLRVAYSDLNFAYCDIPKLTEEPFWKIDHLANAFKIEVWLTVLQGFLLSLFVTYLSKYKIKITQNEKRIRLLFSFVSTLLSNPLFELQKLSRQHKLLIAWAFSSLVLNNLYTAVITSVVIIPPEEDSITEISQLFYKNYTLIFRTQYDFSIVNASARQHQSYPNNFVHKSLSDKIDDFTFLAKILDKGYNITNKYANKFGKILAFRRKVAVVYLWAHVIRFINDANAAMSDDPRKRPFHCYIGKRLIPSGKLFQLFIPPNGQRFRMISQSLLETGFYKYWYGELYQMQFSPRVQERSRVLSATKVRYDFLEIGPTTIKLGGRIKSLFFLLIVGVLCSIMSFLSEVGTQIITTTFMVRCSILLSQISRKNICKFSLYYYILLFRLEHIYLDDSYLVLVNVSWSYLILLLFH